MARRLRLDDQETDALRRRSQLEGRSMQEVARQAAGHLDDVEPIAEHLGANTAPRS